MARSPCRSSAVCAASRGFTGQARSRETRAISASATTQRARAIAYLEETVGFELFFPFDVEVDRYCAEPGGFAGDALSAITLRRLGAARMTRGPAAMRSFHDTALNHGPLSAEALEALA